MMAFLPQDAKRRGLRSMAKQGAVTAVGPLGLLGEDLEDRAAARGLHHPPQLSV